MLRLRKAGKHSALATGLALLCPSTTHQKAVDLIALPPYIDKEAWDGFVEQRELALRKKGKAFTDYMAKCTLYEIQRIKDAGHDPNAAIRYSAMRGYDDVYVCPDKPIQTAASNEFEKTQAYLQEQRDHAELAQRMKGIRRIA
jgi:hypothetical protein